MSEECFIRETSGEHQGKICKKIAQLTRVIFQMNVINDENDLLLKKLSSQYEQDIQTHANNCKQLIAEERQKTLKDLQSSQAVASDLEKLSQAFEAEKAILKQRISALERLKEQPTLSSLQATLGDKEQLLSKCVGQLQQLEGKFASNKARADEKLRLKESELQAMQKKYDDLDRRQAQERQDSLSAQ